MWTEASDAELVKTSALIVTAIYVGQSTFSINTKAANSQATSLTLGILQIEKVYKGDSDIKSTDLKQVFIRVPNPAWLRKSDDIIYSYSQRGLWFLRTDDAYPGLYLADQPQRFVPEARQKEKLRTIQNLLHY